MKMNEFPPGACTCGLGRGGWDAACPLHHPESKPGETGDGCDGGTDTGGGTGDGCAL